MPGKFARDRFIYGGERVTDGECPREVLGCPYSVNILKCNPILGKNKAFLHTLLENKKNTVDDEKLCKLKKSEYFIKIHL